MLIPLLVLSSLRRRVRKGNSIYIGVPLYACGLPRNLCPCLSSGPVSVGRSGERCTPVQPSVCQKNKIAGNHCIKLVWRSRPFVRAEKGLVTAARKFCTALPKTGASNENTSFVIIKYL